MTNLRIGIPSKGRLAEMAGELLKEAGLNFRRPDRACLPAAVTCRSMYVPRTEDIPVLCAEGAIDMGLTGSDLVAEHQADVLERLPLDVGHCRLAICVPEQGSVAQAARPGRAADRTSFPNTTLAYLAKHGMTVHLVPSPARSR